MAREKVDHRFFLRYFSAFAVDIVRIPSPTTNLVNGFFKIPVFGVFRLLLSNKSWVLYAHRVPLGILHKIIYGENACRFMVA